jgi:hypothetical protein
MSFAPSFVQSRPDLVERFRSLMRGGHMLIDGSSPDYEIGIAEAKQAFTEAANEIDASDPIAAESFLAIGHHYMDNYIVHVDVCER